MSDTTPAPGEAERWREAVRDLFGLLTEVSNWGFNHDHYPGPEWAAFGERQDELEKRLADFIVPAAAAVRGRGADPGRVTVGDLVTPVGPMEWPAPPDRPSSVRGGPLSGRGAADEPVVPHEHATDYDADTCDICFPEDARPAVWANPVPLACACTLPSETDDIGSTCPACRSAEADGRGAADTPSLADALKASLADAAARRGAADGGEST